MYLHKILYSMWVLFRGWRGDNVMPELVGGDGLAIGGIIGLVSQEGGMEGWREEDQEWGVGGGIYR